MRLCNHYLTARLLWNGHLMQTKAYISMHIHKIKSLDYDEHL